MNFKYYLFILFFSFNSFSQNFSNVDELVSKYPSNFVKIEDLVLKVNNDFKSPIDKSRAVFYWVCNNISYDINLLKTIEIKENAFTYKTQKELVEKEKAFNHNAAISAFHNKSAICFGYSALYSEILNKLGIECKIVRGNLKCDPSQIGVALDLNHGWNMVKIDNEWKLVDCTLGAGRISSKTKQFVFEFNDVYFFTNPELFYLIHFPIEQNGLLNVKFTKLDYVNFPIFYVDFFKNHEKIILPKKGVISSSEVFILTIKDFNIDEDYLDYRFSNDSQRNPIELNSDSSNATVALKDKANQTLSLYLNNKLIAVYKII